MSNYNVIIDDLFKKYSGNGYMTFKLESYIQNLPILLSNIEEQHNKRIIDKEILNKNKDDFITNFLSENQFFYIPQSEIFIDYNNLTYKYISEDDILHLISNKINNQETKLQQWKFKIQTNIIKIIKDSNIGSSIPESITIQNTLNKFYPTLLKSKNHAKFFLTILGDNILNKKSNLVYLTDISFKNTIQLISQQLFTILNKNLLECFKYKYSDHTYNLCRIFENNIYNSIDMSFIKSNILDIIAVSCYYSKRYNSADNFLENCYSKSFTESVLFLKNNTQEDIINKFIQNMTVIDENSSITFKNIYYIWRQFLNKNGLPLIMNQNTFKSILENNFKIYDSKTDTCLNIKTKYASHWIHFQTFWTQNIIIHDDDCDNNYEINELITLFNDWSKNNSLQFDINEHEFKEMIIWNDSSIIIQDNKYVLNITCKLWDKTSTIDIAIQSMEEGLFGSFNTLDLYKYYCKFINKNYSGKYIASKYYFDKYINNK